MTTKLQHYVPQFYLKGFADPEKPTNIWVYEMDGSQPRSQGIQGTAAESHYYSLEAASGGKDDGLETEVLAPIESAAAPIIQRWRSEPRPMVTEEDAAALTPFLAALYVRSPRARRFAEEITSTFARKYAKVSVEDDQFLERFVQDNPGRGYTKESIREAVDAVQDPKRFAIKITPNAVKAWPFLFMRDIAPYITRRYWSLLLAPAESDFITSDSPFSVFRLDERGMATVGVGIGHPGAELTLPLSPQLALRLSLWERRPRRRLTRGEMQEINRRVACQAIRFVYASRFSKRTMALVEKFSSPEFRRLVDSDQVEKSVRANAARRRAENVEDDSS